MRGVDNMLFINYEEYSVSLPTLRSLMKSQTKKKREKNSAAQINPQIFHFSIQTPKSESLT